MKRWWLMVIIALIVIKTNRAEAATDYWQMPGMMFRLWDQGSDYATSCPRCGPAGGILVIPWREMNPGDGSYNFSKIENYISTTRNMRTAPFPDGTTIPRPFIIETSISLSKESGGENGDMTPSWIYGLGVPRITDCNGVQVPNYGDQRWRDAYYKFLRKLAESYGDNERVAAFIIGDGFEDEAYFNKSNSCSNWNPFGNKYNDFLVELASNIKSSFTNKRPAYLPAGGEAFTSTVVEAARVNGIGVKSNTISGPDVIGQITSYKSNFTGNNYWEFLGKKQYYTNTQPWGAAARTTNEISWAFEDAKGFGIGATTVAQNVYYQWLLSLSYHPDFMDWRNFPDAAGYVVNSYPYMAENFVPTYMHKTKANTPGAWIAFWQIMNETIYSSNPPRDARIVCWKGSNGAGVCNSHQVYDLEYYLEKVLDTGSVKKHVGDLPSPASGQIFGFGRELPDGKLMSMRLEGGVWFGGMGKNVKLKVILLNFGSGSVKVSMKKTDGSVVTETINKGTELGEINKFVEVERTMAEIKFDGTMDGGGDVVVRSEGGATILHMLELKPLDSIPVVTPTVTPVTTRSPSLTPTVAVTVTPTRMIPSPTRAAASPTRGAATLTPTRVIATVTPTAIAVSPTASPTLAEGEPTVIPTEVNPSPTETVEMENKCPANFGCYEGSGEYKWLVPGYVKIGFGKVDDEECGNRGVARPLYKDKERGDANCDGYIDGADYSVWRKEFIDGNKREKWEADFDNNEEVDERDLDIWRINLILGR